MEHVILLHQEWQWLIFVSIGLLIMEMVTGTFYLLVIAIACAIAAIFSYFLDTSIFTDLLIVAVFTCAGYLYLYLRNRKVARLAPDPREDLNANFGSGAIVRKLLPGGRYELDYRGTTWNGVLSDKVRAGNNALVEGSPCIIVGQDANTLVIEPLTTDAETAAPAI